MKSEYNFEKAKKNPYVKMLKKQITISNLKQINLVKKQDNLLSKLLILRSRVRLEQNTVNYFKNLAKDTGVPYQTLIDMYLTDCANKKKKLALRWST